MYSALLRLLPLALALVPLAAPAQQTTFHDPLADALTGRWVLTGTIRGRETTHDVDGEWVLNHQYVRLHEVSREKDDQGRPQYEAMVFVGRDEATKGYVAVWLDVWGGATPQTIGRAKPAGNSMAFEFVGKDDVFRTTFTYDEKARTWEWRMDADRNGKLEPFARLKLTRKP